jgi:hypothetical protein
MTEVEVLEDLLKDDPFLRAWPTFRAYLTEWIYLAAEIRSDACELAPDELIFEFYAARVEVARAMSIVEKYA